MNKISFLGALGGVIGTILIASMFPLYGLSVWLISNILLGYTNRHDKNQVMMYIIYEIVTAYGVYNYLR